MKEQSITAEEALRLASALFLRSQASDFVMSTRSMPTKGNNQFFRACSGVLLSFHCETNLSADTLIVFPSDQRPYGPTASKPRAILIVPPNRAQT